MDPETQKEIEKLNARIEKLVKNPPMPDHFHSGFDASRVSWNNLADRVLYIHHTIQGTAAATGTNYGVFYIVPVACYLSSFKEVHQTAGSDAGAVTLQLEKLTGTTAPDSGTTMLTTALSLKATANTVQSGTITGTSSTRTLAIGDRLCLKDAGTLTAVANVTVALQLVVI